MDCLWNTLKWLHYTFAAGFSFVPCFRDLQLQVLQRYRELVRLTMFLAAASKRVRGYSDLISGNNKNVVALPLLTTMGIISVASKSNR